MVNMHLSLKETIIAVTVAMACFLPPFIGEATNIALPNMLTGLGYPQGALYWEMYGWILTIYLLASTVFLIPAARLADKYSKKLFFCLGVLLLGVGSLGIGLSPSGEAVIFMRSIEGLGNALMFGTAIALLSSAVEAELRGTAIGVAMTGVFLGQLAGPLLAGVLTDFFGWQAVYLILCPIALVSLILAIVYVPDDKVTDTGRYDYVGALLFIAGMSMALYGFSKLPAVTAAGVLVAGLVILAAFTFYERKNANPIVPIDLILKNRSFSFNNGANLLYYVAIYSLGSLISVYLTNVWGITDALPRAIIVTTQGLVLVLFTIFVGRFYDHLLSKKLLVPSFCVGVAGLIFAFFVGAEMPGVEWLTSACIAATIAAVGFGVLLLNLIDRFIKDVTPKYGTVAGLAVIAAGLAVLYTCGVAVELWKMIAVEALFGVGIAIFVTPNSTAIMDSVTEAEYSMASGTLSTTRMLGMAVSIGIVAILKNVFLSNMDGADASDALVMMNGAVTASLVVILIAIVLSWTAEKGSGSA